MKPIIYLNVSHKYNSNSLAAVFYVNKSNAAGNSKMLYTTAVNDFTSSHYAYRL